MRISDWSSDVCSSDLFLTNYRDPAAFIPDAQSRGQLVSSYLTGSDRPEEYAQAISGNGNSYNGFNLVVGDMRGAWYVSNRAQGASARPLGPGNYTLSNTLPDPPWPKTSSPRPARAGFPSSHPKHRE